MLYKGVMRKEDVWLTGMTCKPHLPTVTLGYMLNKGNSPLKKIKDQKIIAV